MLSPFKDVDYDHGAATFRTDKRTVIRRPGVIPLSGVGALFGALEDRFGALEDRFGVFTAQQFIGARQILLSPRVGEQSIVADTVKT